LNQEELKTRTKKFGLRIIKLVDFLPNRKIGDVIGRQILRSATSVGANYRAVCRSRSKAEFVSKINIVLEEADETLYWLELIEESELINKEKLADLTAEAKELVAIFVTTLKNLKNK
jgi:four helix bundle protein